MVKVSFLAFDVERWVAANLVWSEVEKAVRRSSFSSLRDALAESLSPAVRRDIAEGEGNRLAEGYLKYSLTKILAGAWKHKPITALRLEVIFYPGNTEYKWICEK